MGDPREILDGNIVATFDVPDGSMSWLPVNHQGPTSLLALCLNNAWEKEDRPGQHYRC
jgi:hypothetical protein